MPEPFLFTRLYLPRVLTDQAILTLLVRLGSSDIPRPLSFEVHADDTGIASILGCAPTALSHLKRLLGAHVPGAHFEPAKRAPMAAVGRVTAHPSGLPLAEVDAEEVIAHLYRAFAARHDGETVGIQLVLGRAHRPRHLVTASADPLQSLGSRLLNGSREAAPVVRRRLAEHAEQGRLETTLRIGASAPTVKRQRILCTEVFGALQILESPAVHLSVVRDSADRWMSARPSSVAKLTLSAAELLPLLGWPLGERDYPGVPGIHPRLLPVPEIVSRTESVFAIGTAPGPERPIGIDPLSRLQHLVVTGPTGSGKSTLLERLILSDIAAHRACCVIEPKAQLIERILDTAPADAAGQIVVLDATDKEAPVGFNPLDVGDRDPDIVVDGILAAFAAVFHDGWGPRTEYLIQGALLSLARAGKSRGEPYTLIDLPRLLTDDAFRRPVVAAVQDDQTLAAFWAEYEDMRPPQRAAVIASPLNKLRKIVMRGPLVRVLGQSSPRFRVRDIFRDRKTLLVPLNDSLIGTGASRLLGSLIVAELWMATLERATEKAPMKRPGMVFVDEVQNYLHLPTPLPDVLATSRSYGVAWHLAHQYREQLPAAMWTALDVNARSKICFTLEHDDAQAMQKLAPALTAEDFQTLPARGIYTRLMVGNTRTDWCSARTLPPMPATGHATLIREASRERFGRIPEPEPTAPMSPAPGPSAAPSDTDQSDSHRPNQKARRA